MKKIMILIIVCLLSFTCFLISSAEKPIGYKEEIEEEKNSGTLIYYEIKDKIVKGYEPVYKQTTIKIEKCNYTVGCNGNWLNETECDGNLFNESEICWKEDYTYNEVDKDKKGEEIYEYSKVKAIKYKDKIFKFDNKICWVCSDYIACLSYKDGGTSIENRAEEFKCKDNYPIIRSGESGYIINLVTESTIFERSDIGEI